MKSTIERALELAATGEFNTVTQIKAALRRERYPGLDQHLAGSGLRRQLRQIMQSARPPKDGD